MLNAGAEQGFFPYRLGAQSMDWLMSKGQKDYWPVVSKLKQAIDPRGIVSPGRYAPIIRDEETRSSATNAASPPAL